MNELIFPATEAIFSSLLESLNLKRHWARRTAAIVARIYEENSNLSFNIEAFEKLLIWKGGEDDEHNQLRDYQKSWQEFRRLGLPYPLSILRLCTDKSKYEIEDIIESEY